MKGTFVNPFLELLIRHLRLGFETPDPSVYHLKKKVTDDYNDEEDQTYRFFLFLRLHQYYQ
jgi:hypothetical protein